jgi:hypothetical protein
MFGFIRKILYLFLITLIILLFNQCSDPEEQKGLYNIDSLKIGDIVTDSILGVQFNPPKKWFPAQTEVSDKVIRQMSYADRYFVDYLYVATNLFYQPDNKSVLNIGQVKYREKDTLGIPNLEKYITQSTKKFQKADMKIDKFQFNDREYTRLKVNYGVWFTYRILFFNNNGKLVQFEYSTQQKYASKELLGIESSIGSIKFL